jgi:aryl-alcohol dehydrogenase-like predicted oxidoreductase
MKKRPLGNSGLMVSSLCLGTMTWGEQNSEQEAHQQLDFAFERGINFIDAAEMYPVPPKAETQGLTEEYIGRWPKLQSQREKIILATKVVGPMPSAEYLRGGNTRLDRKNITKAIEASLKRLKTDYIDLYQLHWPDRTTNFFGQLSFPNIDLKEETQTPIAETLEVLEELKKAGKIKYFGLSNETPWGVMSFQACGMQKNLMTPQSIQNPYNLLNRSFEIGLSEIALRENIGLLAYSPLAFGALSGKYLHQQKPKGARLTLWDRFSRYTNSRGIKATEAYVQLAHEFGLKPVHLALQFVTSRAFVTSNIIGATSLEQLKENCDSIDCQLTDELLEKIELIHNENPNPCP